HGPPHPSRRCTGVPGPAWTVPGGASEEVESLRSRYVFESLGGRRQPGYSVQWPGDHECRAHHVAHRHEPSPDRAEVVARIGRSGPVVPQDEQMVLGHHDVELTLAGHGPGHDVRFLDRFIIDRDAPL